MMQNNEDKINFFGTTTFRNKQAKFGIKTDDRRRHMYVVGKTGMGKTALLENMAIQDIQAGHGIGYFNPGDLEFPIAFNVMEKVDAGFRHLVASCLMGVFKKIWPDIWSARMEYILNYSILALLEYR